MKNGILLLIFIFSLLLSGCNKTENVSTSSPAPTKVQTATIPDTIIEEPTEALVEIAIPEETESEEKLEERWYSPYYKNGKMQFNCLIKNDGLNTITVYSAKAVYYLQEKQIHEDFFDAAKLKAMTFNADNNLMLVAGDSVLLQVRSSLADGNFDRVIIETYLINEQGEEFAQEYRFTMNIDEVTPYILPDVLELDKAIKTEHGWNFCYTPTNNTPETLYFEEKHSVFYIDGVPVQTQSSDKSFIPDIYLSVFETLSPGQSAYYIDGIAENSGTFSEMEATFVYRNEKDEPYLQTFHFVMDEEYTRAKLADPNKYDPIVDFYEIPTLLGEPQYTVGEIRKMIADGLSLDEVSDKISTLADMLQYLHQRNFSAGNTDIQFWDSNIKWSVSRSAQTVFEENYGDCGGRANIANYILRGDYDEQGYVQESGNQGGHIYNYCKENGVYYFYDLTEFIFAGSYNNPGYRVFATENPQEFSEYYIAQNRIMRDANDFRHLLLQYMYPREGNRLPIGNSSTVKTVLGAPIYNILPEELRDTAMVLFVSDEKYTPEFKNAPAINIWPKEAQ